MKRMTVLIGTMCFLPYGLAASGPTFVLKDLGPGPGGHTSLAFGVNRYGHVTGESSNLSAQGFYYDGFEMHAIGGFPGSGHSIAISLNDEGQIVGRARVPNSIDEHAFLYERSGKMRDLGTLGGPFSMAYDINNDGQVVGMANLDSSGRTHAFLYEKGVMRSLGTLGGRNSNATAISSKGHIVGSSNIDADNSKSRGFIYKNNTMTALPTINGRNNQARGINDYDHIVGNMTTETLEEHAFSYKNGVIKDLGTFGGRQSYAYAVNNSDWIVGYATYSGSGDPRAMLHKDGITYDLNTLVGSSASGWKLLQATDINDAGKIVGFGTNLGVTRAFLLTPVPEPGTIGALCAGVGILLCRRRKTPLRPQ